MTEHAKHTLKLTAGARWVRFERRPEGERRAGEERCLVLVQTSEGETHSLTAEQTTQRMADLYEQGFRAEEGR